MDFNIINLPKVKSTNSYAQKQIEKKALKEGDVIFTLNQEEGKGHGNNIWESEPNSNLLASIILQPVTVEASNQFVLTQIISLAIIDLINEYITNKSQKVKIKWPNDIYVGDFKIAGILFQNFIKGNKIEHSIIGIGINVNQAKFLSSAPNPISLIHYTNKSTDIYKLLQKLLTNISVYYEKYSINSNYLELKTRYINTLYRYKIWADYGDNNGHFRGQIVDIDQYGRLIVKIESGIEKVYNFKEIRFIH
jgi:BirA family biotin operon repressor/biotin-[acetyl-CoA-carboxylase] ligase